MATFGDLPALAHQLIFAQLSPEDQRACRAASRAHLGCVRSLRIRDEAVSSGEELQRALSHFPSIKSLVVHCTSCPTSISFPATLTSLTFRVSDNYFADSSLQVPRGCSVHFRGNGVLQLTGQLAGQLVTATTARFAGPIQSYSALHTVRLRQPQEPEAMAALQGLPSLRTLHVLRLDGAWDQLADISRLEKLVVSKDFGTTTLSGITTLAALAGLRDLALHGIVVKDCAALRHLTRLTRLELCVAAADVCAGALPPGLIELECGRTLSGTALETAFEHATLQRVTVYAEAWPWCMLPARDVTFYESDFTWRGDVDGDRWMRLERGPPPVDPPGLIPDEAEPVILRDRALPVPFAGVVLYMSNTTKFVDGFTEPHVMFFKVEEHQYRYSVAPPFFCDTAVWPLVLEENA